MTIATWRNSAIALFALCGYQRWQSCTHDCAPGRAATAPEVRAAVSATRASPSSTAPPSLAEPAAAREPPAASGRSFYGFRIPAWAMRLTPQPGETVRVYRDRVLPLAEVAVAPQRVRVARARDDLGLDAHQRAELDAAVADAARAIEDRVAHAVAGGELRPATLRPMAGIAIARDVLDIVDRGNTRFVGTLTPDQRTRLASQRFDFADYLVFTARWEDALRAISGRGRAPW